MLVAGGGGCHDEKISKLRNLSHPFIQRQCVPPTEKSSCEAKSQMARRRPCLVSTASRPETTPLKQFYCRGQEGFSFLHDPNARNTTNHIHVSTVCPHNNRTLQKRMDNCQQRRAVHHPHNQLSSALPEHHAILVTPLHACLVKQKDK